jgi:hypothetical protein
LDIDSAGARNELRLSEDRSQMAYLYFVDTFRSEAARRAYNIE